MKKIAAIGMILAALLLSAAAAESPSQRNLAKAMPGTILDFAGKQLPECVSAKSGKISLSGRHYLLRGQSLRWDFKSGDALTFSLPIRYFTPQDAHKWYKRSAICVFTMWVYNEKALPKAQLRFEFGSGGGKPETWFDYGLNFTGWRAVQVAYGRDMQGKPSFDMDSIRIAAPSGIASGTIYIDALIPAVLMDDREQDPDQQQPFVKKGRGGKSFDSPLEGDWIPKGELIPLSDADRAGFKVLEERIAAEVGGGNPRPLAELEKAYGKWNIRRAEDGTLTGKHISFASQTEVFLKAQRLDEYQDEIVILRDYGTLLLQIAVAWRAEKDPVIRAKLETMAVNMCEHLFDQGFIDGSIRGTSHHIGYSVRELFAGLLLMRDVLLKHGLCEIAANTGVWYNGLRFLRDRTKWPEPDADILNTLTIPSLVALALMPDTPQKAELLRCFQAYYSNNIGLESPGAMGGFKADGCVFHHWGQYPGYGFPAMNGASRAFYVLDGTPWQLSDAARRNLTRALKAAFIYTNARDGKSGKIPGVAMGLCGRHPFGEPSLDVLIAAYRRMAGDPEMAAIYRRFAPKDAAFAGVKPAELPEGHWTFNYGCFGIHRFGAKMVSLKGYNRAVWSSEIYLRDNRYGRYQSNGAIEIIPQGGHRQEGWDWNRNPGTTSLHRPWEVLDSPSKHTLMLTSTSRLSGSSNLEGLYGMFGLELSEPDREHFDPGFRAVKSVFAFGPRLIALGSGIAADSEYPVETTLLQLPAAVGTEPVWFNREQAYDGIPELAETRGPAWVADSHGNAWFVFSDSKLHLERRLQESRHNKTRAVTGGEFVSVRIDHGVKPQNDSYEYLLHLDMTPAAAAEAMKSMRDPAGRPYTVLRRDGDCHAVYDKESNTTGAIFFKAGKLPGQGILAEALTPGYVMFREAGDTLHLSLNTPDLAGFSFVKSDVEAVREDKVREARPRRVAVLLKGAWKITSPAAGVTLRRVGGDTEVEGLFRHGIPAQLTLTR